MLFHLSGQPGELSDDPRAGKYNLERRVELERFRYGAGIAYTGIKSCVLVIFFMKFLYMLFQLSGHPRELPGHARAGKYD